MAVVRDDSPIGEGAVLFGSFGDSLVVSKMKIRSVGQIEQNAWIRHDVSKLTASVYS